MARADIILKEIERLERGVQLLQQLRVLFYSMECDRERTRAWDYLRSRFGEFEHSSIPSWQECLENETW